METQWKIPWSEGTATPPVLLYWENPMDRGVSWLGPMGSPRVGHAEVTAHSSTETELKDKLADTVREGEGAATDTPITTQGRGSQWEDAE